MTTLRQLIDENSAHPDYGRLLYHRNPPFILHYSVQINDHESLGWQPVRHGRQRDTGQVAVWQIDWKHYRPAKWVMHSSKEQIRRALHTSIDHFHENWLYEFLRFNCERWARGVSTGEFRCYQLQDLSTATLGTTLAVTGAWKHNQYAQDLIRQGVCSD